MYHLKLNITLLLLIATTTTHAQIVDIPDPIFKTRLLNHDPVIDINNDGEIQVTEAQNLTTTLQVTGSNSANEIDDMTGIEVFENISTLNAARNNITTIDLSQNIELRTLNIHDNEINTIDFSGNPLLRNVGIHKNMLTEIDVSTLPELRTLTIYEMDISALDVSQNPNLRSLNTSECNLNVLDLTNNIALDILVLFSNPLTSIDLTQNSNLTEVILGDTQLRAINFSENPQLEFIDIRANEVLEEINLKNSDNDNIDITSSFPSNFTNLPLLERVCIDDVNSDLAVFILDQVAHPVAFSEDCSFLGTTTLEAIELELYPNPVLDFINIKTNQEISSLSLYNISGAIVVENNNISNEKINITSLQSGVYIVRIVFKNGSIQTQKIVVY